MNDHDDTELCHICSYMAHMTHHLKRLPVENTECGLFEDGERPVVNCLDFDLFSVVQELLGVGKVVIALQYNKEVQKCYSNGRSRMVIQGQSYVLMQQVGE